MGDMGGHGDITLFSEHQFRSVAGLFVPRLGIQAEASDCNRGTTFLTMLRACFFTLIFFSSGGSALPEADHRARNASGSGP